MENDEMWFECINVSFEFLTSKGNLFSKEEINWIFFVQYTKNKYSHFNGKNNKNNNILNSMRFLNENF